MNTRTYSQIYATRPLPEPEQRRIRGFGMALFGLEVLFVVWCLTVKAFLISESIALMVIYALAFVIAVFFIITGVMLYQAYYSFWCTPFPLGIPLRLGLVFGGVACAWIFNFVVLIFLVVLFAVIIPQQKLQREALVKAQSQPMEQHGAGEVMVREEEDGGAVVGPEASVAAQNMMKSGTGAMARASNATMTSQVSAQAVNAGGVNVSGLNVNGASAGGINVNNGYATRNPGGGYGLPVTLAIVSVLNILWSGQLAAGMASSFSSSYASARGMAAVFGWILLLPGAIMGIVFFFVAMAWVRLMRKYGVSKNGVWVAYVILEILAAVSVTPFILFWIGAAFALGG